MSMAVDEPGLFEEPPRLLPAEPEGPLTRGQKTRRKVARRILAGTHPLGYVPLHPLASRDPDDREAGPRCGGCAHRRTDYGYPKCFKPFSYGDKTTYPRATHSETSDVRAWWPACHDYQEQEQT